MFKGEVTKVVQGGDEMYLHIVYEDGDEEDCDEDELKAILVKEDPKRKVEPKRKIPASVQPSASKKVATSSSSSKKVS